MPQLTKSHELGQKIIEIAQNSPNSQQMLLDIASILGQRFQVDACIIIAGIKEDESQQTICWQPQGLSNLLPEATENLLSQPWVQRLTRIQDGAEITEIYTSDESKNDNSLKQSILLKTALGIGTHFRERVNGVILLCHQKPHKWTQREKNLLKALANSVAIACAVSQLHFSGKDTIDKDVEANITLTNLARLFPNQGSPLIQRLYELMRQQLAQQRQLNELKDNIIAAISDKARNPLASMKVAIKMLQKQELPEASKQRYLNILEDEWQQLDDLIDNIVTIQQLESNDITITPQPILLNPMMAQTIQLFREKWQENQRKSLELVVEGELRDISFYSDPKLIQTILNELLNNAGNFANRNSKIWLKLHCQGDEPPPLTITITNIGCAIASDEQEQIFELFYRGKDALARSIPGTGIGLALVKGLVSHLNGRIEFVSEPTDDPNVHVTTFTLTLPQLLPSTSS